MTKVKILRDFLARRENFEDLQYTKFPSFEHMRRQMFDVLGHLSKDASKLKQIINDANGITIGEKGNNILDIMSKMSGKGNKILDIMYKMSGTSKSEKLKPGEAILQSLLSPHRQMHLITCTINSLINRDLHNHPERLAEMYSQILSGDDFLMPSGYSICQQSINVKGGDDKGAKLIGAVAMGTMSMGALPLT